MLVEPEAISMSLPATVQSTPMFGNECYTKESNSYELL